MQKTSQTLRITLALLSILSLVAIAREAAATSGAWSPAAVSGDWSFPGNWAPTYIPNATTFPNQSTDVATFTKSIQTSLTISQNISVSDLNFENYADAFTISLTGSAAALTVGGVGVQSGATNVQTLVTQPGSHLNFINSAAAANGQAKATIINLGSSDPSQDAGSTNFYDHSTGGNARIINSAGTLGPHGLGAAAFTGFANASNAGYAQIVNAGSADVTNYGAVTDFGGTSSAQNAQIENQCGNAEGFGGGRTVFEGNASADYATIHSAGGCAAAGGLTYFSGNSTAANGYFVTDGASPDGPGYGVLHFGGGPGTSKAGYGSFIVNGATVGGGAGGGYVDFNVYSSADHGWFQMGGGLVEGAAGSEASFVSRSTAGNAFFDLYGGSAKDATGATIQFSGNSTAANARFYTEGGSASGASGGTVWFLRNSTAGTANLIAIGGMTNGAGGGVVRFSNTSSADNALIFADGGMNGNAGGLVRFAGDTSGGRAFFMIYDRAALDISYHNLPGMSIGSLEGNGNVYLGSNVLSVGTNDVSRSFAGHIQDGGLAGGSGGGLAKIGNGTLTFEQRPDNDYIGDSVSLSVVTGSPINLNFSGEADRVLSLIVDGVTQPPGVYGSVESNAPHQLSQFTGAGTVLSTLKVTSRKSHGPAGVFDVDLPLIGPAGIECRSGGPHGNHTLVFNFAEPLASVEAVNVTAGTGVIDSSYVDSQDPHNYIVNLTGVSDAQKISVAITNAVTSIGKSVNASVSMGVLVGDVNGDGVVDAVDSDQTTAQSDHSATPSNFRDDVNSNGMINDSDVSVVQAALGQRLP